MYWKKTKKSHPGGCFLNEKTKVKNLLLQLRLRIHVTRLCLGNSDSDEHLKGDTDGVTIVSVSIKPKITSNVNNIVNRKRLDMSVGKKRHRNESCTCDNKYCNSVAKFLGSLVKVDVKYYAKRPSEFDNQRFPKKLKRSKIIISRKREWRENQIRSPPSRTSRLHDIHFPIAFLKEHKGWDRLSMRISLYSTATSKMSHHAFVSNTKTLVIPILQTQGAIQVSYKNVYFSILLVLKHNKHSLGSHLERYHDFRYVPHQKTSGQILVHVSVLQLLFTVIKQNLSTTISRQVSGKERVCMEIERSRLWSVCTKKYDTGGYYMLVQWFPS